MAENKQYIISFLASLQGDKLVVSGLQKIERAAGQVETTTTKTSIATKGLAQQMGGLTLRAIMVVPIWLAIRSAMTSVLSTIKGMIDANIALEEGLAGIRTAVSANSTSIESDMKIINKAILEMALKSSVPIKDLADAFLILRKSNLTTAEAMAAFEPTVALSEATMNSLQDTAKTLVGVYNTMGDALGSNLSTQEKFKKIGDTLAYTWATQGGSLEDLGNSYKSLAPYVAGTSDNFVDLITVLGVLNTHLTTSSRAGTTIGRDFMQLISKTKQLADVFGITFDSSKQLSFMEGLKLINDQVTKMGGITNEQGKKIENIFGLRGAPAIESLIKNFDELQAKITETSIKSEGFSEKLMAIREETTEHQFKRMSNILGVLANAFGTSALNGVSFAHVLKEINDSMANNVDHFREAGITVAFYVERIQLLIRWYNELNSALVPTNKVLSAITKFLLPITSIHEATDKARISLENMMGLQTREQFGAKLKANMDASVKSIEEIKVAMETVSAKEKEIVVQEEIRRNKLKDIQDLIKYQTDLLKIAGASELDIAKFKDQQLDAELKNMDSEQQILAIRKSNLDIMEKEVSLRKEIQTAYLDTQITIAKTLGASELDIIYYKKQQLDLQKSIIGEQQYSTKLEELMLQKAVAIANEKRKEWDLATGLLQQYEQGDKIQQDQIKRVIELIQMKPSDIADRFKNDMFDRKVILDYFNHFTSEGKDAVNQVRMEEDNLNIKMPTVKTNLKFESQMFPVARQFSDIWLHGMMDAINRFKAAFLNATGGVENLINPTTGTPIAPQRANPIKMTPNGNYVTVTEENIPTNPSTKYTEDYMHWSIADAQNKQIKEQMKKEQPTTVNVSMNIEGKIDPDKIGQEVAKKIQEELDKTSTKKKLGNDLAGYINV